MKKNRWSLLTVLFLVLLALIVSHAQQPQSQLAPIFRVNAAYVQGFSGGGYALTKGSGLTLNIGPGTANCEGSIVTYAGGTLTESNATNYVYLDSNSSCAPATSTSSSVFAPPNVALATVFVSSSVITSISDDRTFANAAGVAIGATKICSQVAIAMPTGAIASTGTASTTGTCTGLTSSDSINCTPKSDIFGVTGFVPTTSGILTFSVTPSADTITAKYANNTAGSITPGALTINCNSWR